MSSAYDAVIVGGGISGMSAAYRLRQLRPGWRLLLLESADSLGGKVATTYENGFVLEAGPDSFLSRKPGGIQLIRELGLEHELVGRRSENHGSFVRRGGKLHPIPEGLTGLVPTDLDLFRNTNLLSAQGIERVAQERDIPPADPATKESVAAFVIRRFGRELYENLMEPLLSGIYAGQADQLSLEATFPQLKALEQEHGSVIAGLENSKIVSTPTSSLPPFVSLKAGMTRLVSALAHRLAGVDIRLNSPAAAIDWNGAQYHLFLEASADVIATPILILALPAFTAACLLTPVRPSLSEPLAAIPYAGTVLVNLAFAVDDVSIPLNGYGYVIPSVENNPVLACTWSSSKWPERAPADHVLLRLYIGRFGQDATALSDDALLALAQSELKQAMGITAPPLFHRLHRWPLAMPQYTLSHLERIATIEREAASLPGLYLAGNYFRGVGIPDCISSGDAAAHAAALFPKMSAIQSE